MNPITVSLTPADQQSAWCLYSHTVEGTMIYVGMCKLIDIFTYPDARTNTEWIKVVKPTTTVQTIAHKIAAQRHTLTRDYHTLISTMRPHCNIRGSDIGIARVKITCNEDNMTFDTVTECADYYKIARSALSNHLNGKANVRSIKGRTYRREAIA